MNIYVGNLSYGVTEGDLEQTFGAFGKVESVRIIKDNYTGRSRGFGFVDMTSEAEAQSAIEQLNGQDMKGRSLIVNVARSRSGGRRDGGRRGRGRHS